MLSITACADNQVEAGDKDITPQQALIARREIGFSLALLLVMVCVAALTIVRLRPSEALSLNASPVEFSASRARQHLEVIAQRPHPLGSIEHATVRDYLLGQLQGLGLIAEIQKTTSSENILTRLKGTQISTKAVMVVGHYDTVMTSPGASDDGAAVASMLETLRALKASSSLKNDVIFLFSDGEETGSTGAKGFIYNHPWAKDVAVVLNFEARGTSGPVIMFETSSENGWLIDQYANAAVHPVANSLSFEIYEQLPNDTDLTFFKEAGYAGLNFAFISNSQFYHTSLDNLSNLDLGSLQDQGATALALTRRLGNANLEDVKKADDVYFDFFGAFLIRYPQTWAIPMSMVGLVLFGVMAFLGVAKRRLTTRGVLYGFAGLLLIVLSTLVGMSALWWLVDVSRRAGLHTSSNVNLLIYAVSTIVLASASYLVLRKHYRLPDLLLGAFSWWLLLALAGSLFFPGGSYLFTWPLLFSLATSWPIIVGDGALSKRRLAMLALGALPGIVLVVPIGYLTCTALGSEAFSCVAVVVLLELLLLGQLLPHLNVIATLNRPSRLV